MPRLVFLISLIGAALFGAGYTDAEFMKIVRCKRPPEALIGKSFEEVRRSCGKPTGVSSVVTAEGRYTTWSFGIYQTGGPHLILRFLDGAVIEVLDP